MKKTQLLVSHETLKNYIKEHNNTKVGKFINFYTYPEFQKKIIESFDKLYLNTLFEIEKKKFPKNLSNFKDTNGYQIFFKTNSNTKYRIDLIPVKNFNSKIKSDFVWSISFTLASKSLSEPSYEEQTQLDETKEVLLRVGDILNNVEISKFFIIGKTIDPRKSNIYNQILLTVFKNYNVELDYCEGMIDEEGLYIWK